MKKKDLLFWCAVAFLILMGLLCCFVFLPYKFTGFVCICLAGLLLGFRLLNFLAHKYGKKAIILRKAVIVVLCLGLTVLAVTEAFVIHASFGDPEESCDYIVVLGCMVRHDGPSLTLQNRIHAAYDYLTDHPDVIAVVSGGQGADEPMTEAKCMYDHLVEMGIDPERIWMEEQAKSTWGNMHYTLDLIEAKTGTRPQKLGLLSSEYHLFRASLFARECGVEPVGIPARTTNPFQAINHFMREVAGVWHYIILGGQYD